MKVLGPVTNFLTWGSNKGSENPQEIWLWSSAGFDYRTSTGLGKQRLLEIAHTHKSLVCTRTQEKGAVTPPRDWARPACEWLGVSGGVVGRQWLAAGSEALTAVVLGGLVCWHESFWRRSPLPLPLSGQTTRREESSTHKQKIGLKIYWAWPCPPKQNPVLATASPSHQEACTGLLSASIRGQTEWKPQSQKTNQNDHMNHNFV